MQDNLGGLRPPHPPNAVTMPSILEVLASSINIMQVRLARSRLAGEPPDLIVAPRLAQLRLLDYHRAKEAIEEGRRAVERVAHMLTLFNKQPACLESLSRPRGDEVASRTDAEFSAHLEVKTR
jgi:NTE family protein